MITVTYWLDGEVLEHNAAVGPWAPVVGQVFVHRSPGGVQRRLQVAEVESSNGTREAVDLEIDVRLKPERRPTVWPDFPEGLFPEGPMPRCPMCGAVCPASGRCFSCDPGEGFGSPEPPPPGAAEVARAAAHAQRVLDPLRDVLLDYEGPLRKDYAGLVFRMLHELEQMATEWRAIHDENQQEPEEEPES